MARIDPQVAAVVAFAQVHAAAPSPGRRHSLHDLEERRMTDSFNAWAAAVGAAGGGRCATAA